MRDLTRLELITEAVRAALEEAADTSPHLLDDLVDEDWGRRYGRPVRLGKNPTAPKTRILATGNDAVRLLEHLHRHGADRTSGSRRPCARSWCTTTTVTPQDTCAGDALGGNPRGGPTRKAAHVGAVSSGRCSV
ncbi:hypothetical protein [Streptomyces sp. NPDC048419]|uniref:hypothetical protein n=1 Tax=Streptomyces sp. NPDC048419 TaxID=3365547 RepID=UPI00371CE050